MLLRLKIENFLAISNLEVNWPGGLVVLTGESGSGKSMILRSLESLFAPRLSSDVIQTKQDRARLEASFAMNAEIADWLRENALTVAEEVTISREITHSGSKARIDGELIPSRLLPELRRLLLEFNLQGASDQLNDPEHRLKLIDEFAGQDHCALVSALRQQFANLQNLKSQLNDIQASASANAVEAEFLNFQLSEFERLAITDLNEEENLKSRIAIGTNAASIAEIVHELNESFSGDENPFGGVLRTATRALRGFAETDENLGRIAAQLDDAVESLSDALRELSVYVANFDDTIDLDRLNARLSDLQRLRRKYGFQNLHQLIEAQHEIQSKLDKLNSSTRDPRKLTLDIELLEAKMMKMAEQIGDQRARSATLLTDLINSQLAEVGMKESRFEVIIKPNTELQANGLEQIEFALQTAASEPSRPIREVASGGELSRLMMLLSACKSKRGTYIFDEVDAGTSGKIATAIAEKLYRLTLRGSQVICITHQPAVACYGDAHWEVQKHITSDGRMSVELVPLQDSQQKIESLLSLIGSQDDKIHGRDFLNELLSFSKESKYAIAKDDSHTKQQI